MSLRAIFLSLFFVGMGIYYIIDGTVVAYRSDVSADWPSVQGKIITSEVVSWLDTSRRSGSKITHEAKVSYRYFVKGRGYSSNRVSFDQLGPTAGKEYPREIVDRYPEGKGVKVYYDPADPGVSVLEVGDTRGGFLWIKLGAFFFLLGLVIPGYWIAKERGILDLGDSDEGRINRLAIWGVVFSLIWMGGIGSLIAIRNGMKIRRLARSNTDLKTHAAFASAWCIVVGVLGILIWIPIILYPGQFNEFLDKIFG